MRSKFKRSKEMAGGFSECCGRLGDGACRCAALRERTLLQELWLGERIW